MTCEHQNRVGLEFVRHHHRALHDLLPRLCQFRLLIKLRATAAFGALGDAIKHLDALERIFADGGFAAQHDRVRLFKHGIRHVGDFRARRHRRFNHALQHVRRHDDGFSYAQTRLHDAPLHDGQFLVRNLDS